MGPVFRIEWMCREYKQVILIDEEGRRVRATKICWKIIFPF